MAEREYRTMSELFREVLRHYLPQYAAWEAVLQRARKASRAPSVASKGDVERFSDQHQRSKRR